MWFSVLTRESLHGHKLTQTGTQMLDITFVINVAVGDSVGDLEIVF